MIPAAFETYASRLNSAGDSPNLRESTAPGNVLFEAREEALIQRHQLDLAHRRQRLFLWNGLGFFLDTETRHSSGDGARAHHDKVFFSIMELGEIAHQPLDSPLFDPGR